MMIFNTGTMQRLRRQWQSRPMRVAKALRTCALAALATCAADLRAAAVTIQAEDYAYMNGIVVEATQDTGGGKDVTSTDAGDWLSYATVNLPCSGTYSFKARVASKNVGGTFNFEKAGGGATYAQVKVPRTGGKQVWKTIVQDVTLPAGDQAFGIAVMQGGWNLNWFRLVPKCSAAETAQAAARNMHQGFNLGNMFDATQNPPTFQAAKAKIDAYYAQSFRNVRIPITWTEVTNGSMLVNNALVGDVNRTHPRLAEIKQTVDYALSLPGMYVVINAHHEVALKDNNRSAVLERLWADIADIFKDRGQRLIFEILNEPHLSDGSAMPPANLRNMTSLAYNKIRAVAPQRIVVIGGNQWFGAGEMAQTWPNLSGVGNGNDAYLMAEFHHYSPWSFNGDNQGDYADNWTDTDMSAPMDTMLAWAHSTGHGMPVYIGEWGTGWGSRYQVMQCNNIRLWYQKLDHQYASAKGMPTAVWDDGGWFKIFDHHTNSFANNLYQCISGSCTWDGGERFNSACY